MKGRTTGSEDSLHGRARHRAVAVTPHDGAPTTRGGLDTPGVAAVISDPADLERGQAWGGPEDVESLAEAEAGERHPGHSEQDVTNPQSSRLPGGLQWENLLDPDQVGPGGRGLGTSINRKAQSQGVSLYFHLKSVVEVRKFRYEQSIWFLERKQSAMFQSSFIPTFKASFEDWSWELFLSIMERGF